MRSSRTIVNLKSTSSGEKFNICKVGVPGRVNLTGTIDKAGARTKKRFSVAKIASIVSTYYEGCRKPIIGNAETVMKYTKAKGSEGSLKTKMAQPRIITDSLGIKWSAERLTK